MFKIGEKVVFVDDSGIFGSENERRVGVKFPIKNNIYTIREIETLNGITGFRLEEIVNRVFGYNGGKDVGEKAFKAERFRKLDYDFAENLLAEITESVMQEQNQN